MPFKEIRPVSVCSRNHTDCVSLAVKACRSSCSGLTQIGLCLAERRHVRGHYKAQTGLSQASVACTASNRHV